MTKTKIVYIRLDEETEKAVEAKVTESNLNQSSAIRMIIREWQQLKGGMISIPKAGIIVKDGKVELNPEYWQTPKGIEQSR